MLSFPRELLPLSVAVTSIELLKNQHDIQETLNEMKTEKTLKVLKLLNTLQAQARRAAKLKQSSEGRSTSQSGKKRKPVEPSKEEELRVAFDLFDEDKSGSIDKGELGKVMGSLGMDLPENELANLLTEMDTSGDGLIEFSEFCESIGGADEEQTAEEMANAIFALIDKDGSGDVSMAELEKALLDLKAGLEKEDIAVALELFDTSHDGHVTRHEFVQAVETMKTFD
jgi:Ca2+-binding EF-hand superfamily protein